MPLDGNTVKAIFMVALDRTTPAERMAYLDEACAGDAELRKRVEELLLAHAQPDAFLDMPATQHEAAAKTLATVDFLEPSTRPGSLGRLGHYEVLETVGKGGMGTVLRAFDAKLHRIVAVKVLAPELAGNPGARQRFVREARAAAAVTHDNVIAIHAVEDEGPIPFLIMQFIEGCTLQQKLDRTGALPLKEILRLGVQIADGLVAAHRLGMVHRDVKPANILLENGIERVKITDFGLARAVDDSSLTRSGWIAGTPNYMSPEQANGERVDQRSDLFSLGSVLYAMCAGHPPFRAESSMGILKRVCHDTPRPLRELNPEFPGWLSEIVAKLQAKNPAQRFASAAEVSALLSQRLSQLQLGGESGDFKVTQVERAPAARRRALVLFSVLLVALLAAVAGWFVYKSWNGDRQETATGATPTLPGSNDGQGPITPPAPDTAVTGIPRKPIVLRPSQTLLKHVGAVRSLLFSPDGKTLASGSEDKTIILWDTATWTRKHQLAGHSGDVFGLAFSSDSSKLASTTLSKDVCAIRFWDVATGAKAGTMGGPWDGLFAVAWLPDGKTLVTTGQDNKLTFWDDATGQHESIDKVCSVHVRTLSISPNGKLIATGGSGPQRLWDLSTRKEVPSHLPQDIPPVFLPPDGTELAGYDHMKGTVSICNLTTGKVRPWRAHPDKIEGLAVSPDGRFIATVGSLEAGRGQGIGYVWSVADLSLVAVLPGHRGRIGVVAFTPDGTQVATAGLDDHNIFIWDLKAAGLLGK
jgi:serine/threonine protein kinase